MGTWGFLSSYDGDVLSTLVFSQRWQDSCLVSRDTWGFSLSLGRAVGTAFELRRETQGPFPVATRILKFLSIFKRSQASSPVEACNSTFLWRCQRGVKPPVEMRWGTRAISRVSTRDSSIPSCYERKRCLHLSHCREIRSGLASSDGNSVSIPLEAANSGSLSHTYT